MDGCRLSVLATAVVVGLYATIVAAVTTVTTELVEPEGPGVCTSLKITSNETTVTEYKIENVVVSYFCLRNLQFKCTFNTDKITPVKVVKKGRTYKTVSECCEGYLPKENGKRCGPVCNPSCKHGKCILPNVCLCDKYYEGPICAIRSACPLNTYGPDCKETCQCQNNGSCNPFNGFCRCQAGYMGPYCESLCPPGFFGYECRNVCKCRLGDTCDPVNGACSPPPKHRFRPSCPKNFYGPDCKSLCKCQNGALCNSANGNCLCQPGFIGSECEAECPPGYYGYNCIGKCNCINSTTCNPETGSCQCDPGKKGDDCNTVCPTGTFGLNCSSTCVCLNGATCRPTDGVCLCKPGFYGHFCAKGHPQNLYPMNCDPKRGCVPDSGLLNNNGLEQQIDPDPRGGASKVTILLTVFCIVVAVIAIILCRTYNFNCNKPPIVQTNENNSKLQNSAGSTANPGISVISRDMYPNNNMINSDFTRSYYTKNRNYDDSSISRENYGYDTTENVYLEIDESTGEPEENEYDHLDFLRPTKSWKPHYHRPHHMQVQTTSSSCCRNCSSSKNSSPSTTDKDIK